MKFRHLTVTISSGAILLLIFCSYAGKAQVSSILTMKQGFNPVSENDGPTVSLIYKDTLSVPSITEFNMPVIMQTGHDISAISLGFYYPQEYLEITGMELADSVQGFSYTATDGLFRVAWSDINPINIADEGTIIILKMKSMDLSLLTGTIKLEIDQSSEFADSSANIIEAVMLEIPEIQYLVPDTLDSLSGNYVLVYPNPFDDYTTVNFYIKDDSKVKISLFNLAGMDILQFPETDYPKGSYQVNLFGVDLSKGIYLLKFEIINAGQSSSKLIKIMSIR